MALIGSIGSSSAVRAAAGPCNAATDGNFHAGMTLAPGIVAGAEALITFVNQSLCTKPAGYIGISFSSSWVAIAGTGGTFEIYQVGFYKCQVAGCPTGTRYVWAYGRQASTACGVAVSPTAQPLGALTSGTHRYTIVKNATGYAAQIDGVEWAFKAKSQVETCWANGSRRALYHNEVSDLNDQSGGGSAAGSKQPWQSAKYQSSSLAWTLMNEPFGISCSIHQLGSQRCAISTTSHSGFLTWDSRFP